MLPLHAVIPLEPERAKCRGDHERGLDVAARIGSMDRSAEVVKICLDAIEPRSGVRAIQVRTGLLGKAAEERAVSSGDLRRLATRVELFAREFANGGEHVEARLGRD